MARRAPAPPRYLGLRDDKPAGKVVRERPIVSVKISHPEGSLPTTGSTRVSGGVVRAMAQWMLRREGRRELQRYGGHRQRGFFTGRADYFPEGRRVERPDGGSGTTDRRAPGRSSPRHQTRSQPSLALRADRIGGPTVWDRLEPRRHDLPRPESGTQHRRAARESFEPVEQVTVSKGINVWTPIQRRDDFEHVKEFADELPSCGRARPGRPDQEFARRSAGTIRRRAAQRYPDVVAPTRYVQSEGPVPSRRGTSCRIEAAATAGRSETAQRGSEEGDPGARWATEPGAGAPGNRWGHAERGCNLFSRSGG